MKEEPADLDGTETTLSSPKELARLAPRLLEAVSPRLRALFADPRPTLTHLANETTFAPLAGWLRLAAQADSYDLAIYAPGPRFRDFPIEAYLRIYSGASADPLLVSGGLDSLPRWLPPPLAEVLGRIGVIRMQWNVAGALLRPSEQTSLEELHRENADVWFIEGDSIEVPPHPEEMRAFYLASGGGYIMTNPSGETWNARYVGGHDAGPPIDAWLTAYLEDPWLEGKP